MLWLRSVMPATRLLPNARTFSKKLAHSSPHTPLSGFVSFMLIASCMTAKSCSPRVKSLRQSLFRMSKRIIQSAGCVLDSHTYEFTTEPTLSPPEHLLRDFKLLIGSMEPVLGLYYHKNDQPRFMIERTEGRSNITEPTAVENKPFSGLVDTAWKNFGEGDPVTMACVISCDTRTTRSGNANVHKGTQTHSK